MDKDAGPVERFWQQLPSGAPADRPRRLKRRRRAPAGIDRRPGLSSGHAAPAGFDCAGAGVELRAVTRAHDEVGGRGIADRAPGMWTDGVVGDEAVLGGLKDEARVACLWIGELRRPADRHITGQANPSPKWCRRAGGRRHRSCRCRAVARCTRCVRAWRGKRDALALRAFCAAHGPAEPAPPLQRRRPRRQLSLQRRRPPVRRSGGRPRRDLSWTDRGRTRSLGRQERAAVHVAATAPLGTTRVVLVVAADLLDQGETIRRWSAVRGHARPLPVR